jgi:uncharacterized NAD(P)/FAD-binding protein YdhS
MTPRARGEHTRDRRRVPRPVARDRERTIAVVGAGASGTLAAVHLLRRGCTRVTLIDPGHHGLGVAYRTREESHLLNAPALAMSALADESGDLLQWCWDKGLHVEPEDFLPRRVYGTYLRELLARFGGRRLQLIRGHVESVVEPLCHRDVRLALTGGRVISADAAVLALGNPPPAPLAGVPAACTAALVNDPWAPGAMRRLAEAPRVAIIGTGLTAVDVALSVAAANPDARVSAISRHGWLPRAHLARISVPHSLDLAAGCSLDAIIAAVGRAIEAEPVSWRGVVDGLRLRTTDLWQGLRSTERERFERELRSWWEIHRHRLSPTSASHVETMLETGRLAVHAQGVRALRPRSTAGVRIELGAGGCIDADVLINATGPSRDLSGSPGRLTRRLLASGRACPDELGVGLATSPDGALIDVEGVISRRCFTLGPPRRGELLESTAIPEIRQQAAQLARLLARAADAHTPEAVTEPARAS